MPLWGRMLRRSGEETTYDRAVRLFDEGRYAAAVTELEAVLAHPRRSPLTEGLARFYLAEAHAALAAQREEPSPHQALTHLQRALTLHPTFPDLHYRLACALVELEQTEHAREAVAQALVLNPHYADARRLSEALGKGQEAALRLITEQPSSREDEVAVHARLALSLYRQGEFEAAADAYRQALALAPTYADLHNQLGVTLHAADQDEGAVAAFTRALELNPQYVEARLNRGIAFKALGRESDANDDFQRVLELDPHNVAVREALG